MNEFTNPTPKFSKFPTVCITVLVIYLIMIVSEASVFNIRHWTTRFSHPAVNALEYEGYNVEKLTPEWNPHYQNWNVRYPEIRFTGIRHPIRTVFVMPQFNDPDIKRFYLSVRHHDQSNIMTHTAVIINGYYPSYYIPIGAMGDVEYLNIIIHDSRIDIQSIYFNETFPWTFQWIRVWVLTFVVSLVLLWKKFGFNRFSFNPQLVWQKNINASVVTSYILLLLLIMIFSVNIGFIPGSGNEIEWNPNTDGYRGINNLVVEALLMGQLNLDIEPHYSLLNASNPHSFAYRLANWVHAPWDHVFFEGRFFSYFGIVPVVILFLPYFRLSGEHMSPTMATFIFSTFGAVGIYFLWKELTKKYFSNLPYTLFVAGLIAALVGSNLTLVIVRAFQYEVAISSALSFSVWGLFFIFRAVRNDSYLRIETRFLFYGGVCLALAVGCRPTMILSSFLVPIILWPTIRSCLPLREAFGSAASRKAIGFNILALATPYAVIGAALAWYNFARFGSIFEFGANYQITAENVGMVTQTGVLSNLRRVFDGVFSFLFSNFQLRPYIPFVFAHHTPILFTGHMARTATIGAFVIPITWFLPAAFFLHKKSPARKAMPVIIGMAVMGVLIAVLSTVLIGVLARYSVDFFWLLVFPSLICMGLVYNEARKLGDGVAKIIRNIVFVAVGISCFIIIGWGLTGEENLIWRYNPVVMRFLADLILFF